MPPGKHNQPHNPYASAAGAYGTNAQKNALDPREVEARALLKSAQFLQDLQGAWDGRGKDALEETLKYNRNIWMMFYDTAVEDESRPGDIRSNIYNLANFIFKRELDILARPEKDKLSILIKINRDIAGGLMNGVKNESSSNSTQTVPMMDEGIKNPPSGGWNSSA